jgi:preprotein translocase subunit SecF
MMWRGITYFRPEANVQFIRWRPVFLVMSALLVGCSIVLILFRGLNFGVDFTGGIMVEVRLPAGAAELPELRSRLSALDLGDVSVQEFGEANTFLARVPRQPGGEQAQQVAVERVRGALPGAEFRRIEVVGPQVSSDLLESGIYAVLGALAGILIYIWFRFEWQFGLAALSAIIHDVISTLGIFALFGFEFNLTTVAAVLMIAGYSINDTVVVFDRVRENLRRYKTLSMGELFNRSINETLSRTVMTSATTLVAVFALYILGGEVIRDFSFALIWGIAIGTYSSICVALPLLLFFDLSRGDPLPVPGASPTGQP